MQVTNGDIWEATTDPNGGNRGPTALNEILAEKWPIKISYWLVRLARKLSGPRNDIAQVREKLIRDYGTEKEGGQIGIQVGDEHWLDFNKAYNELMSQEVEIEGIDKIVLPIPKDEDTADQCPTCKRPKREIKPITLLALGAFIDVAEE